MIEDRAPFVCLLTDNETHAALCLRYWALDAATKWNEPFDTLVSDSGLSKWELTNMLKSACRAYLPHLRCHSCGKPLQVGTRSDYSPLTGGHVKFGRRPGSPVCASCQAAALASNREADLFAQQQHRDRVIEVLKRLHENAKPVDFANLNFVQSCLLYAALVAANVGPDDRLIPPLESQSGALAPTPKLSEDIYSRLYADQILLPALSSNPNAFMLNEEAGTVTFSVRTSAWTLADDVSGRSIDEIFSVLFERLEQPEPDAVEELWYLVAENECKRYFVVQCERYRFIQPDIYSSKVATAVRHYLDRFSIGQVWNIIFYVLKDLAALSQERTYARQHIYNMIPGSIRRYADNRLANGKPIHPWRRPSPTTESWITSILLDKVLKGGDISFETLKGQDIAGYVERLNTGGDASSDTVPASS
jgi:hypothetical protein